MNNLTNDKSDSIRRRLLASASIVSLVASVAATVPAIAAGDAPVTVSLDWQIDNTRYSVSEAGLPLGSLVSQSGLTAPLSQDLTLSRNSDLGGTLAYRPGGSDWEFSLSVRYGRAAGKSRIDQALAPIPTTSFVSYVFTYPYFPSSNKLSTARVSPNRERIEGSLSNEQSHLILDFDAGKDVGIGLLGPDSNSILSVGVRFAQFSASRQINDFQETHGIHFQTTTFMTTVWPGYGTNREELWNTTSASGSASQTFNGLGPSIKWEASAELWHDPRGGGLSFDWGANAALLFGKQKKTVQHKTTSTDGCVGGNCPGRPLQYTSAGVARESKSVTVPNVGGFVGLSLAYPNAKVSLGYRADLFVNAVDVGYSSRKSSNLLFHGPYASISIGIGD